MDTGAIPSALQPVVQRSADGTVVAYQHDPDWPRGLVVVLWLLALACGLAARWGTDEAGAPPWLGYAVGAAFALGALLVPKLAPSGYEVRFEPRSQRWHHVRRSLGQTRCREGRFDELEAVELRRVESLDDAGATVVSFAVRVRVRRQRPLPFFETPQHEAARLEATRLARELGCPLLDGPAVDAS